MIKNKTRNIDKNIIYDKIYLSDSNIRCHNLVPPKETDSLSWIGFYVLEKDFKDIDKNIFYDKIYLSEALQLRCPIEMSDVIISSLLKESVR